MRIIQISGRGRVGKTTLAHLIAKHAFELGYKPVFLPFADAIKKAAESNGITKEINSEKYRDFCQQLGASKRAEDPDYWVTKSYESIQEYMVKEIDNKKENQQYYEYLIIQDDVRYMNELAFGRDLVATQIFLSSGIRSLPEELADWRLHESEMLGNAVDSAIANDSQEFAELFDVVIMNDDSQKDLEKIVKDNLEEWLDLGYLELEAYEETDQSDS